MALIRRIMLMLHGMSEVEAQRIAKNGHGIDPMTGKEFFLSSWEWHTARMKALKANDGRCECCGRNKHQLPPGEFLCVDHIKPRTTHPWLALSVKNLQCLDTSCNRGKGRKDTADWRHPDHPHRKTTGL